MTPGVGAAGTATDADEAASAGFRWTPGLLAKLRRAPTRRRVALVVAALVGLGLASIHWLGLFAAGLLVGLASRTVPRAVGAGLAVGGLALVVTVVTSPGMGVGEFLGLQPLSWVAVGVGLVAPAWGSLVRAVV